MNGHSSNPVQSILVNCLQTSHLIGHVAFTLIGLSLSYSRGDQGIKRARLLLKGGQTELHTDRYTQGRLVALPLPGCHMLILSLELGVWWFNYPGLLAPTS